MAMIPTDNNLMSPMGDMSVAVALGAIKGYEGFRKFGMNDAVTTSTTQEMWPIGTAKIWPTSAGVVTVASTDINDDGDPASTGAWDITISGLDADFLEVTETLTLDGTTNVIGTQEFIRINSATVNTAGTSGNNEGDITGTIGGNPQFYIEANEGQTHQTHYTVPANKLLMIRQYRMNVGRMSGNVDLHVLGQIRLGAGEANQAWKSISDIYLWNGEGWFNDDGVTLLPPKTDIRQVIGSTATTQCSSTIAGYLIETRTQGNF